MIPRMMKKILAAYMQIQDIQNSQSLKDKAIFFSLLGDLSLWFHVFIKILRDMDVKVD
ncbi:hypothetical protein MHK_005834, partial [Candidatus Magnetomorum sp. HK-1]